MTVHMQTGAELNSAISRLEQVTERLLKFEVRQTAMLEATAAGVYTPGLLKAARQLPPFAVQASLAGKAATSGHPGQSTAHAVSNGNSNGPVKPAVANGASTGSRGGSGIAAYDKLLQEQLKPFMDQAVAIGGEVC